MPSDVAELWDDMSSSGIDADDGHIVKGAQQTGHIAERAWSWRGVPPARDGLALEVDDVGIAFCDKNLAEVEVAMNAGQQAATAALARSPAAIEFLACSRMRPDCAGTPEPDCRGSLQNSEAAMSCSLTSFPSASASARTGPTG